MAAPVGISSIANLRLTDMRPKEQFTRGDQVRVSGREISGRIVEIDPDGRLAKLDTMRGIGWWYLKDVVKI